MNEKDELLTFREFLVSISEGLITALREWLRFFTAPRKSPLHWLAVIFLVILFGTMGISIVLFQFGIR